MSDNSKIEWTDATWNPTTGCTKISAGCANCYAERLSLRLQLMGKPKYRNGFKLTLHPDTVSLPLLWKEPKKIFVNSMSDLFHKDIPFEFTDSVWEIMNKADWHIYQILTKRPEIMLKYITEKKHQPDEHIWLGTSVENQKVKGRIDILRQVPAKIRFLSLEPLLDDLGELNLEGIHWVIVGGESGPHSRPIDKKWVVSIRKQCKEQKVPFFFKQWGGFNKKGAGRLLEGKIYNEMPIIAVSTLATH